MYTFGRSNIKNVNSWQKVTDTIVFVPCYAVYLESVLVFPQQPDIRIYIYLYILAKQLNKCFSKKIALDFPLFRA
jgi:hypothetical protein